MAEIITRVDALNKSLYKAGEKHGTIVLSDISCVSASLNAVPSVKQYFAEMYANVSELRFDFIAMDQVAEDEGYLRWTMHYRHPRLAAGRMISVEGCSHLGVRHSVGLWDEAGDELRRFPASS